MVKNLLVSLTCVLIFSCTGVSRQELVNYINNPQNNLNHQYTRNELKIVAKYKPSELLAMSEYNNNTDKNKHVLDSIKNLYNNFYYFNLDISVNEKELLSSVIGYREYDRILRNLIFRINEFTEIVVDAKDTIEVYDFILPNTYGMTKANSVLLAFERRNHFKGAEKNLKLILNEFGLGIGQIEFAFDMQSITAVPNLDFKNIN